MVEPEWTDRYRDVVLALALHDRELCPGCGLHPAVLADRDHVHLTLEDTFCEMCKLQARHGRRVGAMEEEFLKANKDPAPEKTRPTDGLHTRMKNLTPAEVAERKLRATKAGTNG